MSPANRRRLLLSVAPLLLGMTLGAAGAQGDEAPNSEVIDHPWWEDQAGWLCATDGNKVCGPGSVITYRADGSVMVEAPDGSTVESLPNGQRRVTTPSIIDY